MGLPWRPQMAGVLHKWLTFCFFMCTVSKKLTTYEYIMKKRQEEKDRDLELGEKQSRPTSAESSKVRQTPLCFSSL